MAHGQAVRQVNTPASTVWRVIADHQGMSSWGPGLSVSMERDGEPDPDGVGAVRAISGPGIRIREEITGFEAPRRLAYRALSGVPLPGYAGEVELAEHAGRTTIRWSLTASTPGSGIVLRVIANGLLSALLRAVEKAN
jgi:uncharacterized protein YndB with AHSA1/START domain